MSVPVLSPVERQKPVRLRKFFSRHKVIGDSLPVALLAMLLLPQLVNSGRFEWHTLWLMLALLGPLLWRRRYPFEVFVGLSAVALGQYLIDVRVVYDVALLVALYSVALRESTRKVITAAVILEIGVVLAAVRWADNGRLLANLVFLSGMNVAALISGAYLRTRQNYLISLEERARQLEDERESEAQLAAATERARIAREMHDIVSHSLSVMVALADGATFAAERSPERAVEAMRNVASTGRGAMTEMRRLLGVLRTDQGDMDRAPQPGIAQLDELIDQVRSAGLTVRFDISGAAVSLPGGVELTIYRIVQESLTNTIKHGQGATEIAVTLTYRADAIELSVLDNGELPAPQTKAAGYGINGMRERAEIYGGRVTAGPGDNGGWRVSFHIDRSALRPT